MTPALDITLTLAGIEATERLASVLSGAVTGGDVICLTGNLGAGKTAFARGFIRARASRYGVEVSEVPSPTFTLVQVYELPDGDIWHFDLFRIERPEDVFELGIEDAVRHAICLIEWPDRLPDMTFPSRLDLVLSFGEKEDDRTVHLSGDAAWFERLSGVLEDG